MEKEPSEFIPGIVKAQRQGRPLGIYSICSANQFVLEAGMFQAKADGTVICIESTSNQVNQFGGYMGMNPAEFVRFVENAAVDVEFPVNRIIFGGDHLGPHVWKDEGSMTAMAKARELVRRCVLAGYTKIHLDTSMRCADDPGDQRTPLKEEIVTERAADLCQAAEAAYSERLDGFRPLYVIGTEVPIPGGEREGEAAISVTKPEDVEQTLALAREAFLKRGLKSAWERVIALVVQPGVDFGDAFVFEYDRRKARQLSLEIERHEGLVFEAHSTDYQMKEALKQMVEDHFAILKVGPWLTYAFREAVFALAGIEQEWLSARKGITLSHVGETLEKAMLHNPVHWRKYYHGDEAYLHYARKYSYSDRSRYYWPEPDVQDAILRLLTNLSQHPAPLPLLSQYLPIQYEAVRRGELSNMPKNLIHHKVREVLRCYAYACRMRS
jgi:D-tagatose-1,6-bisphosphate aldolase subunit GatZ/KbaZ